MDPKSPPISSRIQQPGRKPWAPVVEQVGPDEGDFADHVAPAEVLVEFYAVEGRDMPFDQHQIAQMQVAVAFTHATAGLARGEIGGAALELRVGPARQLFDLRLGPGRQQLAQFDEIFLRCRQHLLRCAETRLGGGDRRGFVEGQSGRELRQVCRLQRRGPDPVERPLSSKRRMRTAHSIAVRCFAAAAGFADQHHVEIQRRALVAQQLGTAAGLAPRQGAVIKKGQGDRFLDL